MPNEVCVGDADCPIERAVEQIGGRWNILLLRDAMAGTTRFDDFNKALGIAPNMLTRRLVHLVNIGLLERHRYCERPPRDEYRLTTRGRDFAPVLLALFVWGAEHFGPQPPRIELVDRRSGDVAQPVLVDQLTGDPIARDSYHFVARSNANAATIKRLARQR